MSKGCTKWEPWPRGNEGRRRRLEKGQLDEGLCKTAPCQRLIRCSCWRSERVRKQWEDCVRHGDAIVTKNEHVFTFIMPMNSIKSFLSAHTAQTQRHFTKLGPASSSTFLSGRNENSLYIFCCEVFLLRVVLSFVLFCFLLGRVLQTD